MTDEGGGWYPDPEGQSGRERWWDGERWTDRTRGPADELSSGYSEHRRRWPPRGWPLRDWPPQGRQRRGLLLLAALAVAALGATAIVLIGRGDATDRGSRPSPTAETTTGNPDQPAPGTEPVTCRDGPPAVPPPGGNPTTSPNAPRAPSTSSAPNAPRVSDPAAGISYAGQGEPWRPWKQVWVINGLNVQFATGYYIVTQRDTPLGEYYASVLSGTVATRIADAPQEETRCIAEQVAEGVRAEYYPEPNLRRALQARAITVGGRPGYLIRYHLSFDVEGYDAKGEQVGVLVLDVGRPRLAVLYVTIPDTVRDLDYVIDQVLASVHTP